MISWFALKNIFALMILLSFLTCNFAHAWIDTRNFEGGTIGQRTSKATGGIGGFSNTLYSNTYVHSGSMAAEVTFPEGSDCWGVCGGQVDYPQLVYENGEIWIRGYFYLKSPWVWTCSPRVKMFRIHVQNGGYISAFADNTIVGNFRPSNEVAGIEPSNPYIWDLDRWQSVELYVKFSATPGQGIFRIWKDGILIFEDRTNITLRSSGDYADLSYIFSYWNGGVPQTQYAWIDDFVFTTDRPSNQDANGNYMIGPLDWGNDTILAPTNLRILN